MEHELTDEEMMSVTDEAKAGVEYSSGGSLVKSKEFEPTSPNHPPLDPETPRSKETVYIPEFVPPPDTRPKKVAIVGFSASSRDKAPFKDPEFELWGMNSLFQFNPGPWHKWFEFHDEKHWESIHKEQWPKIEKFFKTCGIPLFMQKHVEKYPTSMEFPLNELNEYFGWKDIKPGLQYYYESTVGLCIGFAEMSGFEEIHLYGIDMTHDTEWAYQRPNTEFFLGHALGKGIKVYLPPESALLSSKWLYGYEDKPSDYREIIIDGLKARRKELNVIVDKKTDEWIQATMEKVGHECARQELDHFEEYLRQLNRGRKV